MPTAPLPDRFETGPIVLRRWDIEDLPALVRVVTDSIEHLRPWMEWIAFEPQTVAQRAELLRKWDREWLEGGDVVLGIFFHEQPVGGTGLHRRIGPAGLEIGYWLREDHVGRGLATKVSRMLTTGAFTIPEITHVEIHCDEANRASAKVPERLGFTYTGNVDRPIVAPSETGSHRVYRMTRDAWLGAGAEAEAEAEEGTLPDLRHA